MLFVLAKYLDAVRRLIPILVTMVHSGVFWRLATLHFCVTQRFPKCYKPLNFVSRLLNYKRFPHFNSRCHLEKLSPDTFQLLCRDGSRVPISDYRQCSWGQIPSDAIVTSSARSFKERNQYQQFMKRVAELYSDGIREEPNQPQTGGGFNTYNGNNYNDQNRNNYNDQSRNNPYDNFNSQYDNSNPYNRNQNQNQYDRFDGSNYRNERLDSSFTTDRSALEGNTSVPYEKFRIFESRRYGKSNLLFQVTLRK